ncbi:hypothetical protein P3W53_12865 [Pseudomonas denitrificans (nom. rej.)]|nr:hypothetical protein [Pseudomonas denitrificans (nom. rej.)]
MINHLDKQTQPMELEHKRGRGRPATGKALSNADRQRAYRERQKAQRNEIERELHNAEATLRVDESYTEGVWQELEQARAQIAKLEEQLALADGSLRAADKSIETLEKELASRNENEGEDSRGIWIVQVKRRGSRRWKECGNPEIGLETAKQNVDYMQFKSGSGQGEEWRAIRADGMIYWPLWAKAKAPK